MVSHRPLLLSCALLLLIGGCKMQPAADDFGAPTDFSVSPDAQVADVAMSVEDLAMPDLAPACAYGKESLNGGACQCRVASPNLCPGDTHCCGPVAVQSCLSDMRCSSPSARQRYGIAYDPQRKASLIFGGQGAATTYPAESAWELDQLTFGPPVTLATAPGARYGHLLQWDGNLKKILLFGGRLANNTLVNDTWSWDGAAWVKLAPAAAPTARELGSMVWDSVRKRVVMWGGTDVSGNSSDETWEWNGTSWERRTVANQPVEREGHAMAYDSARRNVVLFGGYVGGVGYSNETWIYDGGSWSKLTLATIPTGRAYFDMVYDEGRRVVVMFSGEILGTSAIQDTWEWDGTVWTKKAPLQSPPVRVNHHMVYDAGRRQVLVYGGVTAATTPAAVGQDVWGYDGTTWTKLY